MKSTFGLHAFAQRTKKLFSAGAAAALLLVSYGTAHAVPVPTIPNASYGGTGNPPNGPGTFRYDEGPGDFAIVTFAAIPAPSVTLHAEGSDSPISNQGFGSYGLIYYYHIFGPQTPTNLVPVQLTTTLRVSASGFVTTANATLAGDNITPIIVCAGNSNCDPALGSYFSGTVNELLPFDGSIRMGLSINVYNGVGDAFIDPVLTVPTGYGIAFSNGIGNSAPQVDPGPTRVPEPESFLLVALGLAALATSRRKSAK